MMQDSENDRKYFVQQQEDQGVQGNLSYLEALRRIAIPNHPESESIQSHDTITTSFGMGWAPNNGSLSEHGITFDAHGNIQRVPSQTFEEDFNVSYLRQLSLLSQQHDGQAETPKEEKPEKDHGPTSNAMASGEGTKEEEPTPPAQAAGCAAGQDGRPGKLAAAAAAAATATAPKTSLRQHGQWKKKIWLKPYLKAIGMAVLLGLAGHCLLDHWLSPPLDDPDKWSFFQPLSKIGIKKIGRHSFTMETAWDWIRPYFSYNSIDDHNPRSKETSKQNRQGGNDADEHCGLHCTGGTMHHATGGGGRGGGGGGGGGGGLAAAEARVRALEQRAGGAAAAAAAGGREAGGWGHGAAGEARSGGGGGAGGAWVASSNQMGKYGGKPPKQGPVIRPVMEEEKTVFHRLADKMKNMMDQFQGRSAALTIPTAEQKREAERLQRHQEAEEWHWFT